MGKYESLLYESMIISIYSFLESSLIEISIKIDSKEYMVQDNIRTISTLDKNINVLKKHKIKYNQEVYSYLNDIRIIRNSLVHKNKRSIEKALNNITETNIERWKFRVNTDSLNRKKFIVEKTAVELMLENTKLFLTEITKETHLTIL